MRNSNRQIIVTVSDSHAGHILGLCNPETPIQTDNGIKYPTLTEAQTYLWEIYSNALSEIEKLAKGDPIYGFHLGDVTQGMKYVSEQTSTRISDQFVGAAYNLIPLLRLKNFKSLRIAKGTSSHEFGEGSSDVIVEEILKAHFPKVNTKTIYHGLFNLFGLTIDYAHHGPTPGKREWLSGNEARYYLRNIMNKHIRRGETPPKMVWRGHYHTFVKETLWMSCILGDVESILYILPSMCMLGDFGRQASSSEFLITNGIVAFEVINGKVYQEHKFTKTLDIRTKEDAL